MKKLLSAFLFTLCLFSNVIIYSQNYLDIVNARYYYLPPIQMVDSSQRNTFYELRFETTLPIELHNGNIIGFKPRYSSYTLNTNIDGLKDLRLHTVKLPFFIYWKFANSRWSIYADISPKLNSDFRNISGRHFQIGGMVITYFEKKENFAWQFGLVYNQDTYGPFFMPLLGFSLKKGKNYFEALLPAFIIYERRLGSKFYTGFELELRGETFRLGDSQFKDSFISQLGENKLTFLTEPKLFVDYYLAEHLVLFIKPGFRLFQKWEHYTEEDERIEDPEYIQGTLKNSFYLEMGMALRFRYDEE
jgi:hypothetical protein